MIISDLSHFEEVVSEAPSIVGGAVTQKNYTTTAYKLLSPFLISLLPPKIIQQLKNTKVTVHTVTVKSGGASASATVGTIKK